MISACQKPSYQNEKVAEPEVESSASNEESKPNEYIIVLSENVSIENAISNLQKYDAQVIKDLGIWTRAANALAATQLDR